MEEFGVLTPLDNPDENPILLRMELFLVVAGWLLNEKSIGEWLNNLGKLASLRKLIEMFAIELEEEEGLELLELFLELALNVEDSVTRLYLFRLIVLLRVDLVNIIFNEHFLYYNE